MFLGMYHKLDANKCISELMFYKEHVYRLNPVLVNLAGEGVCFLSIPSSVLVA